MNEFIVWDKDKKCFYDGKNNGINVFQLNKDGTLSFYQHYDDGYFSDEYTNNFYIPFKNTGLKDINGKNIYADSSIFEFDYLVDIDDEIFQKRIGIFYFEKTFLAYHISFLNGMNRKGGNADNYNAFRMKNFKIIDTIQENKLGLIK